MGKESEKEYIYIYIYIYIYLSIYKYNGMLAIKKEYRKLRNILNKNWINNNHCFMTYYHQIGRAHV